MARILGKTGNEMVQELFPLYALGCMSSSGFIEREMKRLPGVKSADVSFLADAVLVRYDSSQVTREDIRNLLKKL